MKTFKSSRSSSYFWVMLVKKELYFSLSTILMDIFGNCVWMNQPYLSSSSWCHAISTDIPDSLSRHSSLSSIASDRSSGLHPVSAQSCRLVLVILSLWRGPQEYITYELVLTSPAVSHISSLSNFDSFRDGW